MNTQELDLMNSLIEELENFIEWDGAVWRINSDHHNDSDCREIWEKDITRASVLVKAANDYLGNN